MTAPDRPCLNCHRLPAAHEPGGCEYREGPMVHYFCLPRDKFKPIYEKRMAVLVLRPKPDDFREGDQVCIQTPDSTGLKFARGYVRASVQMILEGEEWNLLEGTSVVQLGPPAKEGPAWKRRAYDDPKARGESGGKP